MARLAVLWLPAVFAGAQQTPATDAAELSRFQRTAGYLAEAPTEERTDFAVTALTELAAVYLAEADLARAEASGKQGGARAGLIGWSLAVEQYANQLLRVLDELEQGYPASFRVAPPGPVTVSVAGKAVMLGHPRPDQQFALEQRILNDFCSRNDCQRMSQAAAEPIPVTAATVTVDPLWTFTNAGPVCSNEGIEVHFRTLDNLSTLRGICTELAQEVAALANELAWQQRQGVNIDWNALQISATQGRPEHLVRLNAAGDSLLLSLPLLYGSGTLLADLQPWLRARVMGEAPVQLRLDAAAYEWVPSPG